MKAAVGTVEIDPRHPLLLMLLLLLLLLLLCLGPGVHGASLAFAD